MMSIEIESCKQLARTVTSSVTMGSIEPICAPHVDDNSKSHNVFLISFIPFPLSTYFALEI